MEMVTITVEVLAHCNILNNGYQQDSRVLYTFILLFFKKTFWFKTFKYWSMVFDQKSKPQEMHLKVLQKEQFKKSWANLVI